MQNINNNNNVTKFSGARLDFLNKLNQNASNSQQNSLSKGALENKILPGSEILSKENPDMIIYKYPSIKFSRNVGENCKILEKNVSLINDETFIMPEEDVHIRAIWSRQSIAKSMDGKINEKTTLYKVIENEAKIGTYAKEYTGEHADAYDRSGTEKIYHYATTSSNAYL